MDIGQIFQKHIKPWSFYEITVFACLFIICSMILGILVYKRKIRAFQMISSLFLLSFLWLVFESTVFTRTTEKFSYKLIPLWSWYEVVINHSEMLLKENLLNCILLLPMGCLLPFVYGKKIRLQTAFLEGVAVSLLIEVSQLVSKRGLFEWDDMLHNGFGCMAGCLIANQIIGRMFYRSVYKFKQEQ